jgi:hypothetical protein
LLVELLVVVIMVEELEEQVVIEIHMEENLPVVVLLQKQILNAN